MTTVEVEGTIKYEVAGLGKLCETWYKIVGELRRETIPLVVLHGGPGACHEYLTPLVDLAPATTLIFYDQIGNGKSTHLPEKSGDEAFWSVDLFLNELDNLLAHLGLDGKDRVFDLYGHSFGGVFAVEWAAHSEKSGHLHRLVISNSLASMDAWQAGMDLLRKRMPSELRDALDRGDETKNFETPEYQAAMEVFYKRHFSLARPWPCKEVQDAMYWLERDPTTYNAMYGPSELYVSGSFRHWTSLPFLHKIKAPTLLINGAQDEAQDVAMQPFFDQIPHVKWVTLDNAAHFSHVDQREKYMQHLAGFLQR